MSSGFPELASDPRATTFRATARLLAGLLAALICVCALPAAVSARELRVCADPNNLPFSNERGEGFENKIVALIARDLHASVSYVWWAQRRGFIRNTLKAGLCDLVPGTPANLEMLRTTAPYYRSSYAFVVRQDGPDLRSFDDPRLARLTIGVELIGDDGANSPPVAALARRGIVGRLRGFPVYGDYSTPNPPSRIVEAVASGEIDVAIVWGPLAGYFLDKQAARLKMSPVSPRIDGPLLPMIYDISMGVRRDDEAFRTEIDAALARHRAEIDAVLAAYHVPRLDPMLAQER